MRSNLSYEGGPADVGIAINVRAMECSSALKQLLKRDRDAQPTLKAGVSAMDDITVRTEHEMLIDVSDEALEIAGGASEAQGNFTLGACTGLSECPG